MLFTVTEKLRWFHPFLLVCSLKNELATTLQLLCYFKLLFEKNKKLVNNCQNLLILNLTKTDELLGFWFLLKNKTLPIFYRLYILLHFLTSDCLGLVIFHYSNNYQSRNRFKPSNSKRDNIRLIQDKHVRIKHLIFEFNLSSS